MENLSMENHGVYETVSAEAVKEILTLILELVETAMARSMESVRRARRESPSLNSKEVATTLNGGGVTVVVVGARVSGAGALRLGVPWGTPRLTL
jgi:hypothetical protein